MSFASPAIRVSLGLALLSVSVLLLADMTGLIPNQRAAVFEARKAFCESLAVHFSSSIETDPEAVLHTMETIVQRNDGILSMRIGTMDDRVLAASGDHGPWVEVSAKKAVPNQVVVPILKQGEQWGEVQIRFATMTAQAFFGLPSGDLIELVLFVGVLGFFVFLIFIRKTIRQLDPSAVIPGRVKSTLDVLAEGVVLMDKNERIVLANATFSRLAQREAPSLVGRRASELDWLVANTGDDTERLPWLRAMDERQQQTGVILPLKEESGFVRRLAVNGAPILDPKGAVRGVLATFDDVTEIEEKNTQLSQMVELLEAARDEVSLKNEELRATNQVIETKVRERTDDLRQSMEAAQAADRAKSEFLANISHELRTPMHAILSFAQFGEKKIDRASKEKLLQYFKNIKDSGDSLLGLLNDLLDLSKAQAEKMIYSVERTALDELARRVIAEFESVADTANVQLEFASLVDETTADLDGGRVTQVMRNLLSNAIKFSEQGSVIKVSLTDGAIDRSRGEAVEALEISIADEGVGIPEDELEVVFDPFTQSRRTKSGSGGTGLGLAICREIVRGHGGWIRASLRPSGGTLMQFALPREHSAEAASPSIAPTSQS